MKFFCLPLLCFGLSVLSSCQLISPPSELGRLDPSPSRWTATSQAKAGIDTQWVKRFNDPALERLVEETLRSNYDLKILAQRVQQARQQARIAGAAGLPQLQAGFSSARQKSNFLGIPQAGRNEAYNSYGTSLDLSWELDLWGRIRAARSAEIANYEAVAWNRRAYRASLRAQVVKAYFAIAEAHEQVRHANAFLLVNQKTQEAIADRYAGALREEGGTGAQYRLAQSDYQSAKAELQRWKSEADRTKRSLELLLGRYPKGAIDATNQLPSPPPPPPSGLPSELLLRRPDILEAERALAAAQQRKKEASLARFPRLSLTGSAGTATSQLGDLLNSRLGVWSLGAGVTQAILTGGTLQGERDQRISLEREKLLTLQKTVLNAFGEVETALSQEKYYRQRLAATRQAATLAQEALEASQQDYREGNTDLLTLLTAESRYLSTQSTLTSLRRQHLDNRVNLHLALGGDYQATPK